MFSRGIRAAVAAIGTTALVLTIGGSAFATRPLTGDHFKQFEQGSTSVKCKQGTPAGGTISATVRGSETERQGVPFQVKSVYTYLEVQKLVNNVWQDYDAWSSYQGTLGEAHTQGHGIFNAPFIWGSDENPRLKYTTSTSGQYRLIFITALSDQTGLDLLAGHNMFGDPGGYRGHLVTYGGAQCTFAG